MAGNLGDAVLHFKGDTKDLDKTTSGLSSKISGVAKGIGTAFVAGTTVATTALVGLTTSAVKSYADLEQNIGGVETLFKDNADAVIANANRAYKTAGMSANNYMETVTSFSASLLQSLGNDTKKATDYADQAIIDMSDNANKMGTDISMIQNAYQGFAKQNYTMLDNLKLGYGGTKTEMERLIADANRVKEANGEMANLSIDSFADITEAIHIIQNEMNITGTTAKEADETITGSVNSMKASFDNFINGSGSAKELADSAVTAFKNISNAVLKLLPDLVDGLVLLVNGLIPEIPGIIDKLIPPLIKGAIFLIKGLAPVLPELTESVLNGAIIIIKTISDELPTLLPILVDAILEIIPILLDNLPLILNAGGQVINALLQGILNSVPNLLSRIPGIIKSIALSWDGLKAEANNIGLNLIKGIGQSIENAKSWLLNKVKALAKNIINSMKSALGIHSPSTEFALLGKFSILGYTESLENMKSDIQDTIDSIFNLQPNINGAMSSVYNPQMTINVQNNMEMDLLGQLVNRVKTFSGGAKNDYNWGASL